MKWWRKIDANCFRLQPGVEVTKCWGTGLWDVFIDGKVYLTMSGLPTAAGAMAEAEKFLKRREESGSND